MFEDSYLDSFMEGHIGNWSGDEDRMESERFANEEMDEYDSDPEFDYPGLDDQHDY